MGALPEVLVLNGRNLERALAPAMVLSLLFVNRAVIAGHADDSKELTIVSERLAGPGWIWVTARTPVGSTFEFSVWAYGHGPPFAHGSRFIVTGGTYKEQIRIATENHEFRENTEVLTAPWPDGFVSGYKTGGGGWNQALVWVAGNVSSWRYEIRGHGLEIGELATGNSSFLYLSHDFEAPLAIEAYVGAGARVQPDAVKELRFEGLSAGGYLVKSLHSFVGLRDLGFGEPTTELKWTDSKGVVRACPCVWYPAWEGGPVSPRAEPGLHRFEFSTISAGESQIDEIWITGLDFGGFRSALWS